MLNKKLASESSNVNGAILTSLLVDKPTDKNVFNEDKLLNVQANKGEIQHIKISYPKNGLYGLL
ncbi:MAG: hypothetical protein EOO96_03225 [Pedobacter sp.]|nr:MAG: hypothetical protein EOO96_03225 [Pedobacter sp.]